MCPDPSQPQKNTHIPAKSQNENCCGSAEAQTFGQMVDASRPLTVAIKDIGTHRWPWVREELEERAEKTMPVQLAAEIRKSSNKQQTEQPKGASAIQPPAPEKGCDVGDGKNHKQINKKELDGPEPEDKLKPFHATSESTVEQRNRFYDSLYDRLKDLADRLNIKVEWLLGLAAHESGWLDEHNWALRDPFGLTKGGKANLCFNTFRSVIDYWEKLFGPRVKGAASLDDFLNRLGTGEGKYNSVDTSWRDQVKKSINSQSRFIDAWRNSKSGKSK